MEIRLFIGLSSFYFESIARQIRMNLRPAVLDLIGVSNVFTTNPLLALLAATLVTLVSMCYCCSLCYVNLGGKHKVGEVNVCRLSF